MTRQVVFVTVLLGTVLAGPAANRAFAQDSPVNPRDDASFRLGVFYLKPSITIGNLGIDTNVLNTENDRKSDFTFSIAPRSTIWLPFKNRALVTTNVGLDYLFFSKFSNQRSLSPSINVLGELYARRFTLFGQVGTSSQFRQPNVEIEQRVRQSADNVEGGFRLRLGRALSIGASAYRQTFSYDDGEAFRGIDLNESLNHREEGVRVKIEEKVTSLTTVGLVAETRQDRFEFEPTRDADGYRVAATLAFAEKALINGTAEVGMRHVDPKDPLIPAFDGLVARLALMNRMAGGYQVSLGWERDLQYSVQSVRSTFVTNGLSANLRRQLAGSFDANIGASRTRSSYRTALDSVPVDDRSDLLKAYTMDVGYRLGRETRVSFGVSRTNRSSSLTDAAQYSTTRAGFSFSHVF